MSWIVLRNTLTSFLLRTVINADDKKTQPKQVAEAEPVVKPDERSNQMAAKASVKRKSPARKRAQARSPKKTTAAKALNVFSDGNGFESRGNSSALESDTVGNVIMKARLRQRKKS
jgi:hypothetical protein